MYCLVEERDFCTRRLFFSHAVLHVLLQIADLLNSVSSLVLTVTLFDGYVDNWVGKLLFEVVYIFGPWLGSNRNNDFVLSLTLWKAFELTLVTISQ